ncbi:ATP synthase subunit gamma, mitochondrial-like [Oscarella lobularis]|uniref:ATP synthase subunit gamma, mitochondrial-like n=1 Tax=Oscarella lobularis TaxID=121494 RepID=UPI0033142830
MAATSVFLRRNSALRMPWVPSRSMVTLKEISMRLRSVKNIQKITKSMKMVSAAKFNRAERELRDARTYGNAAQAFYDKSEIEAPDETAPNQLIIAVTSDRGLCGGIHSGIGKDLRAYLSQQSKETSTKLVVCGDKLRSLFQRSHPNQIMLAFSDIGKRPPRFCEASFVAQQILNSGYEFEKGEVVFNKFRSVISYKVTHQPFFSTETISSSDKMTQYDDVDADILKNYQEFSLASLIYFGMKEGAASEQSARMTAMDNATKNAGEMIDQLTLRFNRTRQAVITRELIEIISGAAAIE